MTGTVEEYEDLFFAERAGDAGMFFCAPEEFIQRDLMQLASIRTGSPEW